MTYDEISAGEWFVRHARQHQTEQGTFTAAKGLRKRGVPLDVALKILVPRPVNPIAALQNAAYSFGMYQQPMVYGTPPWQQYVPGFGPAHPLWGVL